MRRSLFSLKQLFQVGRCRRGGGLGVGGVWLPTPAVTPALRPAGGQGPGAGVREPGGVDMPDQSGGRSRPELPELHPPGLVFGYGASLVPEGGTPALGGATKPVWLGYHAGGCQTLPLAWRCCVGPCCHPARHAVTLPALCLAALSQIMLFVDGMQGVINHNETVQWLYTLSGSPVSPRCPWGGGCLCPPLPVAVPLHRPSGDLPHLLPSGSVPWCLWVCWVLLPPIWKSPRVPRAPCPDVTMLLGTEFE